MNTILEATNLHAGYGGLQVLNGVNLHVTQGELVALLGPNGCGKSTVLKCIAGLLRPWSGRIVFGEEDITEKPVHEITALHVVLVPQGRRVFPSLTVHENLQVGGSLLPEDKAERRTDAVYSLFPALKEKRDTPASLLSGGQQQMLALGRALMLQPKLLLLDEPSLGVAPAVVKQLFEKISDINKRGTTIVLVEQNAHLAISIASRVCLLSNGKVVVKDVSKKTSADELHKLYFGN